MGTRAPLAMAMGIMIVALAACGGGSKSPPAATHTPIPTPSPSHTAKAVIGGPYIVTAATCLHIRKDPSQTAASLECVSPGQLVIADGTSRENEGYTWYHVTFNSTTGWAANKYLKRQGKLASPSPAST
jgi:hypothetical protein